MEVNRSGLYEARQPRRDRDEKLRAAMDPIIEHFAGYGYRRVAKELVYQGFVANHKRVLRIMRPNGWLCRVRSRRIHTTQSDHALGVFPNRVNDLVVTRTNQLFVADLTYIRLRDESIFLAAILDAHSRRVLSWELGRCLDARLTLAALERAFALRGDVGGVIHHAGGQAVGNPDQGVQYASREYVQRAQAAGRVLSMSRRGQPRDNARMESFFATPKAEEVRLTEYHDLEDARASLARPGSSATSTARSACIRPRDTCHPSNSVAPQGFADAVPNLSLPPALRDALYLPEPTNPTHATVY